MLIYKLYHQIKQTDDASNDKRRLMNRKHSNSDGSDGKNVDMRRNKFSMNPQKMKFWNWMLRTF